MKVMFKKKKKKKKKNEAKKSQGPIQENHMQIEQVMQSKLNQVDFDKKLCTQYNEQSNSSA